LTSYFLALFEKRLSGNDSPAKGRENKQIEVFALLGTVVDDLFVLLARSTTS
jgi:hypothetical protein